MDRKDDIISQTVMKLAELENKLMEAHIGRYLEKGEVVHHIDGDKSNNDISNLLLLSSSDHAKLHAILKRSAERMKAAAKGDD